MTCLLLFIGMLGASDSFSAMPDNLKKALENCPKWIKLSAENTHFIWDLPRKKKPFLLQLESACYPGFLETRQIEILKDWVAQGNILWIIFNPLRDNVPGNKDWAHFFGLNLSLSSKSALITKSEGLILPVRGLTEGVEVLQLGTPNISPAYYTFEGNIIPVLKNREGAVVFGGQNFGAGRIIFDGLGWLFFETEKDWIDPLVFDSQVFWVNFFNWARTCVKPLGPKEEKLGMFVPQPPPPPALVKKEKIDCTGLAQKLKDKFPHLKIDIRERPNGDCVFDLDRVLFDTGKADLREEGRPVLDEIIEILKVNSNYSVRIEGHTDSMPIRGRLKKKFPTNLELSQARSKVVYRYFLEKGSISGDRMTTAGFSSTRPRASNKTQEGRQQNRRTEIILFIKPMAGK
ncbi:MAG: OmpA family protein [Pseudomonadota bacterium]